MDCFEANFAWQGYVHQFKQRRGRYRIRCGLPYPRGAENRRGNIVHHGRCRKAFHQGFPRRAETWQTVARREVQVCIYEC